MCVDSGRDMNWEERYVDPAYAESPPDPFVERFAAAHSPGRALDLACGTGRHAALLARHGWQVTAVDSSRAAIERLRSREPSIDARVADLERGEFEIAPESFDAILDCLYVQRDLWPEIRRGVRPGGHFLALVPLRDDDAEVRPMNPAHLVEAGELLEAFAGWIATACEERKQAGRRRLLEFLARKPSGGAESRPDSSNDATDAVPRG